MVASGRRSESHRHIAGAASCCLLGLLGLSHPASARAQTASATALVTVRVLGHADADVARGAVSVSGLSDLDFGALPNSGLAGLLVVSPSGPGAAACRVGGGRFASFGLALPSEAVVTDGSRRLAVASFTASRSQPRRLSDEGVATIRVGASVRLEPGVPPGRFLGSFPVTVAYD